MERVFFIILIFLSVSGCVKMRDYTGVREGAFGLLIEKGLDEGANRKDYFVTSDGIGVIFHDSKKEIIDKLGQPDKIDILMDKREVWIYEKRGLELYLEDGYLTGWKMGK